MATTNNKIQCFKCQKYKKITIPCRGCSKEFCQADWIEHQQILNEELNVIINNYDQFRQKINEHDQNLQNSSLIERIDQWERNSIRIIQQRAEKCRQRAVQHCKTNFKQIEQKLSELSEEIKDIQRENEFNEIDLNDLKRKLNEINEELNNPSNISIEEHSQSFINEISVISRKESKFQQYGTNATGRNAKGSHLNELYHPCGIFVDKNKTIFIADWWNHRLVEWKCDKKQGEIIAGRIGKGERIDQLNGSTDLIIDQQNHSIIIVDWKENEVRKWNLEKITEKKEGMLVAGGNGKGSQLNQLNSPSFIRVDKDQSVYISDQQNHRVMKWRKDVREGIVVAGGNGWGNNLNQLNGSEGLFVDEWNQIYVADWGNHRIM
ncbi:hypothetical protein I4U23_015922 [Adineta vaga]|nr:hypothetical protein I4U23_015922 [Adineta vaga]